jgi:hypothetical protein
VDDFVQELGVLERGRRDGAVGVEPVFERRDAPPELPGGDLIRRLAARLVCR